MFDTSNIILDYYDDSYTVVFKLDDEDTTLYKYEGGNLVETNLDFREDDTNVYSEIGKQQYDLLGEYIYIDYRNYVDELKALVTDSYNNVITHDEFIDDFDRMHFEITYYYTTLLTEGEEGRDELLSDDISELVNELFFKLYNITKYLF